MFSHFDHVTLTVAALDAAVAGYEQLLGAPPVWRGNHPELGTRAALFGLSNALLELVGPELAAPEAEGMRAWLARMGDGLSALAFGVADAAAVSSELRARGIRVTPPQDGQALGEDGSTRSYRLLELSARSTRGVSVLAVERPDFSKLARVAAADGGSVCALDHVLLRSSDPQAAVALYGQGLGIRLALDREMFGTRMLFFRVGGVTLEVIADPAVGAQDLLSGLSYRVRDLDAAHARLLAAGVPVSERRAGRKPGTQVFSVRGGSCGVPTLFLRDPARESCE